ncbi:DNA topoisomerase IB [Niabella sp. CC-SYL272]|uniref:DNA topoisomerase IB n=1 Tax=Niabella agricola TaxID=2891571 RepID=UPI001F2125DF|nr:DNA topoisomerase IB [Niabella agricola]MCF3108316.1 DNA topoisomerase IB [Niabella agricola]
MRLATIHTTLPMTHHLSGILAGDPVKTAAAASLIYITANGSGIRRIKKGKGFIYLKDTLPVKDADTLSRIRSLVIPPAWRDVWICENPNGHLQCTGIDLKGRRQYRYHPIWSALRNETKFHRLVLFGKALPQIRKTIRKHLREKGWSKQKVLAAAVSIMDKTGLRVGNHFYEKLYGSFGLSTLQNRHLKIRGNQLLFSFRGKKGIEQRVTLRSARLARIIAKCREIPGKELFQYVDEAGQHQAIHSEDINTYIREVSGDLFSSKDFRTWVATVTCVEALLQAGPAETEKQKNECILQALDKVAATLGNTRAVCKKHYVHPLVLTAYETGRLFRYALRTATATPGNSRAESLLLKLLKKEAA